MGSYSAFKGTGMGLIVQYAEIKLALACKKKFMEAVCTSNNFVELDMSAAFGFKIKVVYYVFIKHTDQQSNVRTKIIELLKDIKPELNDGMPDSFDVVALVAALQKEFGISIKGRDITPENFSTVDGIAALLERYGVADEV